MPLTEKQKENRKIYSYKPLFETCARQGKQIRRVLRDANVQYVSLQNWVSGNSIPYTPLLGRIARVLHCRLSGVVEFIDVKCDEGLGKREGGIDFLAKGNVTFSPLHELASELCINHGMTGVTSTTIMDAVPELQQKNEQSRIHRDHRISLQTVHEICRQWHCSIDWVATVE